MTDYGFLWICNSCFGHFINEKNIIKRMTLEEWYDLKNAIPQKAEVKINCPSCESLMDIFEIPDSTNNTEIDICNLCGVVWFDKNEIEDLDLKKSIESQLDKMKNEFIDLTDGKKKKISKEAKVQYLLAKNKIDQYVLESKIRNQKAKELQSLGRHGLSCNPILDTIMIIDDINFIPGGGTFGGGGGTGSW